MGSLLTSPALADLGRAADHGGARGDTATGAARARQRLHSALAYLAPAVFEANPSPKARVAHAATPAPVAKPICV
jgi:hypothetical protein